MMLQPTKSGGRIAKGSTPYGRYLVEWSAEGRTLQSWIMFDVQDTNPVPGMLLSRAGAPLSARMAAPGDWLHHLIYALTLGRKSGGCGGCHGRRAWLNWIGWRGLFGRLTRLT